MLTGLLLILFCDYVSYDPCHVQSFAVYQIREPGLTYQTHRSTGL